MYPLSRAADHGLLWCASAAVLALDGRRGRRAALRGMLALGLTSAVSNAVLKPIFRRARPTLVRSSLLDRVARVPGSTSFPSGHAASAFAFAVGAGTELPIAAVPLGVLATAVAFSRVRTRVHYPGDVIAGAAVGASIAVATRKLWAVAPREPAQAPRVVHRLVGSANANGDGLAVIVNSTAGSSGDDSARDLQADLPGARLLRLDDADELGDALDSTAEAKAIGIVGGDGSINAAAENALATSRPLAVFPGGTLNHFARDLGLDDVHQTVHAVQHGELVAVDVGLVDGKPFLNAASFGNYAALVDAREKLEPRLGKWGALLVASTRLLRHAQPIEVEIDGRALRVWMIFIGNCEYQPPGLAPGWRESLNDGLFDVRYVDGNGPYSRLRLFLALITGQLGRTKVYTRCLVHSLEVRSMNGPLRLARDGETFDGGTRVAITKHSAPLVVYAPDS
jgi:undecaprenyl-diphosphatase